ncbi:MAG: hypothetical protein LBT46_03820 [Planctomycetaceae bacterium]|jgi:hypothetical protein|nr:hypothetical protein [Planctomycetaceae bacterium]
MRGKIRGINGIFSGRSWFALLICAVIHTANIQERDEGIVGDGILYVLPFDTTDRFGFL